MAGYARGSDMSGWRDLPSAFIFSATRNVFSPVRANLALAPADGHITFDGTGHPTAALDMGDQPVMRIATFLSVLECISTGCVKRVVTRVAYHEGQFINASLTKPQISMRGMKSALR